MKRLLYILLAINIGCNSAEQPTHEGQSSKSYENPEFAKYWDEGKAELNNYELKQCRYGEVHNGQAVLIFVTEDMSKSKHVKLDQPDSAGSDAVHVIKMNFTKKFVTGIYPYSMMMSVFTPLSGYPSPIKVTTSSQEWCGHTFTQLNKGYTGYKVQLNSYFESEGDDMFHIDIDIMPEDGIWNIIRTAPNKLPTGKTNLIPSTLYQRLSHTDIKPVKAICTLDSTDSINTYTIQYESLKRTLSISFESNFPYRIRSWEETYTGIDGKDCTTKGKLKKQIMLDYWRHNSISDSSYRSLLMLHDGQ
ncbi:MAG: hypothetical protein KDC11_02085 [Chitinophagaceae bacterium]|nr:hypothetical protein [Chitinophagaceae bacterium]